MGSAVIASDDEESSTGAALTSADPIFEFYTVKEANGQKVGL